MSKDVLVVKSNALIETSYRLTTSEQRIVLICISQVRRDKVLTDQVMYSVSAQELSKLCGSNIKTAYRDLKSAALRLKRREIRITEEPNGEGRKKKTLVTGWIQSIEYLDGEGVINLRFNHDIIPYLSSLNRCFTCYKLKNVIKMSSTYGARIYELIAQWGEIGEREISLSWLREALQLENKYIQMCDFKKRVLDPAINDINQNSNFWIKVFQKKSGRKVTHLNFKFGPKEEEKRTPVISKVLGIRKHLVEKNARPGESYEQAAIRLKRERKKRAEFV